MRNDLQLRKAIWLWLLTFWSASAWAGAAPSTFAADMSAIPFDAIKWAVVLAFIGGAAATTNKIASPEVVVKNVWLEMFKDLLMSVVAGVIIFLLTSWAGISYWLQAAFITIGGYGGSKVLDQILENGLFEWIKKIFGRVSERQTPP